MLARRASARPVWPTANDRFTNRRRLPMGGIMKTTGLVAQTTGFVLGLVIGLFGCANDAWSQQSTAFTYQGQLRDGGTNGSGAYLIVTKLYDAATNGNPIG